MPEVHYVRMRILDGKISCCSQMCTEECPFFTKCPSYLIAIEEVTDGKRQDNAGNEQDKRSL